VQDQHELTLDQVAGRLGVHYQTVYRWVRSGKLPAVKIGTGYVVKGRDLDEFTSSRTRPTSPPPPSTARLERQREAMGRALLEGDETGTQSIARQLISNGTTVTALIERVLVPPLADIGARWRKGELSIYVEHRASAIVERLLGEISPNPRGRRRGRAMVAALAGDLHSLPTTMATACLREDNWHVDHLGADMPVAELEAFATDNAVDLAVISATRSNRKLVEQAKETLERRHGIPTLVGRPGATLTELQAAARQALRSN
jgi:excisionase family DNA binding protein